MDSTIKVCLAADRNYLQHLVVTMASVLVHADCNDRIEFLVLSDGSLADSHFSSVKKLGDCGITIVRADKLVHDHMEITHNPQWPESVYYRLLLPYLSEAYEKMIYLDCDIIVRSSLSSLWNMPLQKSVAGVVDTGFDHANRLMERGVRLQDSYLNSGVVVLNLDRIRSQGYEALLADAARRLPNPEFPDQDWINLMFESDKTILSPKWNAMSHFYSSGCLPVEPYMSTEIEAVHIHPEICHFTNVKPWTMTYNEHPYWFEYWEVLKRTQFAWRYPAGWLKKIFLSKNDTLLFRHIRPAIKRVLGQSR